MTGPRETSAKERRILQAALVAGLRQGLVSVRPLLDSKETTTILTNMTIRTCIKINSAKTGTTNHTHILARQVRWSLGLYLKWALNSMI